ncbi:hypothetical protein KJ996_03910 [Patescibacteria group bacterium]|nr:hypothetical protein [Patescibacteria group bacterium]
MRHKNSNNSWIDEAYFLYVEKFQTLEDLGKRYDRTPRTIRNYFDARDFVTGEKHVHKEIIIPVMDATFFEWGCGLLLCRAEGRNLHWKHIETEKVEHYGRCLDELEAIGFSFEGFVIDGRRGVLNLLQKRFPGFPVQFCQLHQIMIVKRYIPARAKTGAARMLRSIALRLSRTNKIQFETALDIWHVFFGDFMNERTYSPDSKRKWRYTHRRLRSAYFSMRRNLPQLFTCQDYPKLKIPNTTNACDGLFSHLKEKIGRHRGLSKIRRKKMVNYILENS